MACKDSWVVRFEKSPLYCCLELVLQEQSKSIEGF
jgi:hypothetical protein